jgi:hypothetical protein
MKPLSGYCRRSIRIVVIGLAVVAVVCNMDALAPSSECVAPPWGRATSWLDADTLGRDGVRAAEVAEWIARGQQTP